jgi:hypothetical protein
VRRPDTLIGSLDNPYNNEKLIMVPLLCPLLPEEVVIENPNMESGDAGISLDLVGRLW